MPPVTPVISIPPLLSAHVVGFVLMAIAVGPPELVMLTVVENTHPFASFTPIVYEPAESPVKFDELPYAPPFIAYWYGPVPPVAPLIVIVPLSDPHDAFVGVALIDVGPPELLILTFTSNVQPVASFTVTVCAPAERLLNVLFEVNEPPSTAYVNGAVPPVTVPMVIEPLFCPHDASVGVTLSAVGQHSVLVISTVVVYTQPLASLTDIEYEPDLRLSKFLPLP